MLVRTTPVYSRNVVKYSILFFFNPSLMSFHCLITWIYSMQTLMAMVQLNQNHYFYGADLFNANSESLKIAKYIDITHFKDN